MAFVVRDGCKAKEILSNYGKMHKALCGRIKDELQLNIMVMGPSGLHFGLWSYKWLTKSDDWQYWTKKWKYEIAHHLTNDWALFCCLARRKRLVQFEVFEKIYFEWLVQFMVFEKIYKCLSIPNCTKKMIWFRMIYIYIYNQRNSQIANQTRALDVATKFENLKICERNNGRRFK